LPLLLCSFISFRPNLLFIFASAKSSFSCPSAYLIILFSFFFLFLIFLIALLHTSFSFPIFVSSISSSLPLSTLFYFANITTAIITYHFFSSSLPSSSFNDILPRTIVLKSLEELYSHAIAIRVRQLNAEQNLRRTAC
jgi:hypothetical protein